jgi:acetolactate synthase I/II/III large subunit
VRGNQAVAELLAARGLDTVFSMLGGTNVPWIGAGVATGKLRLVPTRHEATCVSAAVGYARSTGRVGLCSVSRGPGFANAVNALIAAVRNHSPIVMVVAQSPSPDSRTAQNVEQQAFTALIGAGFHHADTVAELAGALDGALEAARWNGQPQVVSIADKMIDEEVELLAPPAPPRVPQPAPPATIEQAVDLLARARRPLLLAGQGAVHADARDAIVELAEESGARLATSLLATRMFTGHPHDVGLSGGWAPVAARQAMRESDLVVVFGASFNQFTYGHGTLFGAPIVIHCDVDLDVIGSVVPVDVALLGDARTTAERLVAAWRERGEARRPAPPPLAREAIRDSVLSVPLETSSGLDPRTVYTVLDRVLPPERVIVTDSGRSLPTLPSLVDTRAARDFLVGRGYGSIGLGLGTALGAAAARPDDHVVLVCGDGGLMMSAQELDVVRLAQLRLTVVVMNDLQYGAEIKHLRKYDLEDTIAQQEPPDLVRLVEAFGGHGTVVRTEAELTAVDWTAPGLNLIDVRIDPEVEGTRALGEQGEKRLRTAPVLIP